MPQTQVTYQNNDICSKNKQYLRKFKYKSPKHS